MYVSEIRAEGIFVTFPWWLKHLKSRSKIALFFKWPPLWNLISKKKTITFFWSKLSKLYKKKKKKKKKKKHNFACGNYIFPKTRGNKNKPWTHSTPLKKQFSINLNSTVFIIISCNTLSTAPRRTTKMAYLQIEKNTSFNRNWVKSSFVQKFVGAFSWYPQKSLLHTL